MVDLSPRQCEVLRLIGRDALSYAAAARQLDISPRTVEAHAVRIRDLTFPKRNPRDACTLFYWQHRELVEAA